MVDGFRGDWLVDFICGERNMEFERIYSRGRGCAIRGEFMSDEESFAYAVPKLATYLQDDSDLCPMEVVNNFVDESAGALSGWNLDINIWGILPGGDEHRAEEDEEYDGNQIFLGQISQTFEELKLEGSLPRETCRELKDWYASLSPKEPKAIKDFESRFEAEQAGHQIAWYQGK